MTTGYRIRFADKMVERTVTTLVVLRALAPAEIDAYVASGEWRGKAGGYAVQGIAGAFVTELRGSHTNVIGLPLAEVLADLQATGRPARLPAGGVRGRAVSRADDIAAGLAGVRARIAAAEAAAGRAAGSVRLVAVSKKMTVDDVRAALAAGQLDLGESYGQELRDKRLALEGDAVQPRWHFIGPLQANKVKYVAGPRGAHPLGRLAGAARRDRAARRRAGLPGAGQRRRRGAEARRRARGPARAARSFRGALARALRRAS